MELVRVVVQIIERFEGGEGYFEVRRRCGVGRVCAFVKEGWVDMVEFARRL